MENKIVLFENGELKLDVEVMNENVWLNTTQMAKLFGKDRNTIRRHVNNIFRDKELDRNTNVQKMHVANVDQPVEFFALDVILAVGYRVNSKQGIEFRRWASNILKDYLIEGYAVNMKRLDYLNKTVKLIEIANRHPDNITGDQAKSILQVIGNYTKALDLLDEYDHRTLEKIKGTIDNRQINYVDCLNIIKDLRFADESAIFGVEREHGFESILNDIYQTFGGEDVYTSIEEKACNFLYTLVKNHPFVDGNKRIAATLFIYFLNYYGLLIKDGRQVIDNNTLTAVTLLIAESNPKEKQIIIDLVMNFLNN
jgi:prophage maintenance system killer protein/prophage antirepressor-like protein